MRKGAPASNAVRRLLILILCLSAPLADATEESTLQSLIDAAVELSGYARPTVFLAEERVSPEQMSGMMCGARKRCPVYAAYHDNDIIYVRTDIGEPNLSDHLRFHEVVHWLQHHSGKFDGKDCSTFVAREREAYRLENRYIMEVQHGVALMVIPPYDCPDTEPSAPATKH
jgi:hypothetical protein